MRFLLLILVSLGISAPAFAQSVSVKNGDIEFTSSSGKAAVITHDGNVTDAALAPDGKRIVFIRKIQGKLIETPAVEVEPTELWQLRVDGREPSRLLRCRKAQGDNDYGIGAFEDLQFSSNGKLVYFISPEWVTSGAVHVLDTTNDKERYLFPGNDVKVVKSGEYKDCLLVLQHRYFVGGGSYDWYWLLRPDGKEVGPVGEDTVNFEAYGTE